MLLPFYAHWHSLVYPECGFRWQEPQQLGMLSFSPWYQLAYSTQLVNPKLTKKCIPFEGVENKRQKRFVKTRQKWSRGDVGCCDAVATREWSGPTLMS